jgi:hypothetical protein
MYVCMYVCMYDFKYSLHIYIHISPAHIPKKIILHTSIYLQPSAIAQVVSHQTPKEEIRIQSQKSSRECCGLQVILVTVIFLPVLQFPLEIYHAAILHFL